jgi:hypothetical protein
VNKRFFFSNLEFCLQNQPQGLIRLDRNSKTFSWLDFCWPIEKQQQNQLFLA